MPEFSSPFVVSERISASVKGCQGLAASAERQLQATGGSPDALPPAVIWKSRLSFCAGARPEKPRYRFPGSGNCGNRETPVVGAG